MEKTIGTTGRNTVFSPASISTALAMSYAGAQGDTATAMQQALRFEADAARVNTAFEEQLASWRKRRTGVELAVANCVFVNDGVELHDAYAATLRKRYRATTETADFSGPGARAAVDRCIRDATNGRLASGLPEEWNPANTAALIANVVYFKGQWKESFDPAGSRSFRTESGTEVQAPMMRLHSTLGLGESQGVEIVEIPYQGGEFALDLFVPRDASSLADLERDLSPESLDAWLATVEPRHFKLFMPKFRVQLSPVDLEPSLVALGMGAAFGDDADFGRASASIGKLLAVFHTAVIEVNEQGTEAAAATVAHSEKKDLPTIVEIDRAFHFIIRDLRTDAILFAGRVADPTL